MPNLDNNNYGMIEQGNIDLINRPRVKNADGSISTVRSASVNLGGQEILLPTVSDDGRILSVPEAVQQYKQSGKHLGKFSSPEAATTYAQRLHEDQANLIKPMQINRSSIMNAFKPVQDNRQTFYEEEAIKSREAESAPKFAALQAMVGKIPLSKQEIFDRISEFSGFGAYAKPKPAIGQHEGSPSPEAPPQAISVAQAPQQDSSAFPEEDEIKKLVLRRMTVNPQPGIMIPKVK